MSDLRVVVRQILSQWGHDILYQRRRQTEGTGPYALQATDGFENKLTRYTTRHRFPVNTGLSGILDEKVEGIVHSVDMIYYFEHDVDPAEGDRIYEEDDRFTTGFSTWIVSYALAMRGVGGRVEYWVLGVKRENSN